MERAIHRATEVRLLVGNGQVIVEQAIQRNLKIIPVTPRTIKASMLNRPTHRDSLFPIISFCLTTSVTQTKQQ
jgi:hypothetical protein